MIAVTTITVSLVSNRRKKNAMKQTREPGGEPSPTKNGLDNTMEGSPGPLKLRKQSNARINPGPPDTIHFDSSGNEENAVDRRVSVASSGFGTDDGPMRVALLSEDTRDLSNDPTFAGTIPDLDSDDDEMPALDVTKQGSIATLAPEGLTNDEQEEVARLAKEAEGDKGVEWDEMRKAVQRQDLDYVKNEDWEKKDIFGWTVLHFAADCDATQVLLMIFKNDAEEDTSRQVTPDDANEDKEKDPLDDVKMLAPGETRLSVAALAEAEAAAAEAEALAKLPQYDENGVRIKKRKKAPIVMNIGGKDVILERHLGSDCDTDSELERLSIGKRLLRATDKDGQTPLHIAARGGMVNACECLIANRADLWAQDINGFSPLITAAIHGHRSHAVECIASFCGKALIDMWDTQGRTAMHWATLHSHLDTCKVLISNGASLSIEDNYGLTPAEAAKDQRAQLVVVEEIHTLNLQMLDAAMNQNNLIVKECLEKGAQLDAVDDQGWSALMWAAITGKIDLMQLLIKRGAKEP